MITADTGINGIEIDTFVSILNDEEILEEGTYDELLSNTRWDNKVLHAWAIDRET